MIINKLLAVGGVVALALGLFMLVRDPGHIPLLDANRTLLAETEAEGYCAGQVFMDTRGYGRNPQMMQDCIEDSTKQKEYDHSIVTRAFCEGVRSKGLPLSMDDCLGAMIPNRYWPTMGGHLTNSWNKKFPYPGDALTTAQADSDSRTGGRDDSNSRIGVP